jgi:hypothetical protein
LNEMFKFLAISLSALRPRVKSTNMQTSQQTVLSANSFNQASRIRHLLSSFHSFQISALFQLMLVH